jgi:hypothetical protein
LAFKSLLTSLHKMAKYIARINSRGPTPTAPWALVSRLHAQYATDPESGIELSFARVDHDPAPYQRAKLKLFARFPINATKTGHASYRAVLTSIERPDPIVSGVALVSVGIDDCNPNLVTYGQ